MLQTQDACPDTAVALAAIEASDPERPFVVAQLGQSLDGRIATVSGDSRYINGPAALDHLHRLRAAVDAVMVGVGTVVADNPRLDVRRCAGRNPARVIIDPTCRLPAAALALREDGARRIVVHARGVSPPDHVPEAVAIEPNPAGLLPPAAIVAALGALGLRLILLEGGSGAISRFMDANMIDRLHVLVAPLIIGSGKPALELTVRARLADARRPPTRVLPLPGGDVLFDCDLRAKQKTVLEEPDNA